MLWPWAWLDPSLTAIQYVTYFRLCGWCHVFTKWNEWDRIKEDAYVTYGVRPVMVPPGAKLLSITLTIHSSWQHPRRSTWQLYTCSRSRDMAGARQNLNGSRDLYTARPFQWWFAIRGLALAIPSTYPPNLKSLYLHSSQRCERRYEMSKWDGLDRGPIVRVTQDHWKWHHSIERMRVPILAFYNYIYVPLLASFLIYSDI